MLASIACIYDIIWYSVYVLNHVSVIFYIYES